MCECVDGPSSCDVELDRRRAGVRLIHDLSIAPRADVQNVRRGKGSWGTLGFRRDSPASVATLLRGCEGGALGFSNMSNNGFALGRLGGLGSLESPHELVLSGLGSFTIIARMSALVDFGCRGRTRPSSVRLARDPHQVRHSATVESEHQNAVRIRVLGGSRGPLGQTIFDSLRRFL